MNSDAHQKTADELQAIIEEAEKQGERLESCTLANKRLEELPAMFENCWKEMKALIEYYENFWREHLEALGDEGSYGFYGLFSEDGVWNEMSDFYENMKLISEVSGKIAKEYLREDS